ncbi:MarC family protein [Methanococcoides sp. AM1]|uniref:MarC family protein n=1 Tax=Methanococcoides sp. AM1 TaxID=1201011 RepID=UPI0010838579|nr:MarC family protein [Methanococcoides sp. AM1]
MDLIGYFIYSFMTLFIIVSPITGVITFITLTNGLSLDAKNVIAKKSVMLAFVIAIFFIFTGNIILDILGISLDSLKVAGGLLLFTIAFDMMQAKISRESITDKEIDASADREDIWIFPIAMPILTGPATITTVIILTETAEVVQQKLLVILATVITYSIAMVTFLFSRRIHKKMGYNGMLVLTRLFGLFLGAISVTMIASGIWGIYIGMVGLPT